MMSIYIYNNPTWSQIYMYICGETCMPNYAADNLVKGGGFNKWKSQNVGEKQISVTFQLEKASQIHQIDIGNDGAAFVEVLVGKSSAQDDQFQVVLVASSFMTPLDARAGKNMTSVRMFGRDKLSKAVLDEKWDRVKVVCTQPFNKTIQYGLAFIKFHSPPEEGSTEPTDTETKKMTIGGFKLKSDDGDIKPGTLFSTREKERVTPTPLTGAAAVRAASKLAEETHTVGENVSKSDVTPRNTQQVKRKHSDDQGHGSSGREHGSSSREHGFSSREHGSSSREHGSSSREQETESSMRTPLRKKSTSISSTASSVTKTRPETSLKKTKSEPPKQAKDVAFDKIMKKVVFVLSGFQNPDRGKIRDKAMEMGAEYQGDWGKRCTHLICAFENTPKYNQVNGKGRIVKKDWVYDSYKAKRCMPWRKYRLGRAKSPAEDSSTSDSEEEPNTNKNQTSRKSPVSAKKYNPKKDSTNDPYGGETDSGDDTEDEIRRIQETEKKSRSNSKTSASGSERHESASRDPVYDVSTDDEMGNGTTNGFVDTDHLPELPDIFKGRNFFFYGSLDNSERRKLNRCIVAYNGRVVDYMNDTVSYVITESSWDDNFDQALADIPSLCFIKPNWIYTCDYQQKMVPFQKFVVVPK